MAVLPPSSYQRLAQVCKKAYYMILYTDGSGNTRAQMETSRAVCLTFPCKKTGPGAFQPRGLMRLDYSTPLRTLTTKSCTLVTMVRTDRLPRSRSLFTANSEMSTE